MSYLEEFHLLLDTAQYSRFLKLWEEYTQADDVDGPELLEILQAIKKTPFAAIFGEYSDTILPLWEKIPDPKHKYEVLRLIIDLQTSQSPHYADLAYAALKEKHGANPNFNDFIRLVGLRTRHKFQGAISHFELLVHMQKGNFVFHERGWGVGEVMSVSLVREHALIEFEGISTPKDLSFENAFKNLIPLPSDHFLSLRFGNPDVLEKEGKEEPLKLLHLLLKDLGPKTAAEIKDELCDLVIPEKDWTKWWQQARAKAKKDTQIKSPESSKERFELRQEALTHDTRFLDSLKQAKTVDILISTTYQYSRDFAEVFKNEEIKATIKQLLQEAKTQKARSEDRQMAQKIQLDFLLEDIFDVKLDSKEEEKILSLPNIAAIIEEIEIVAFKKRVLSKIRSMHKEWQSIFLKLLFLVSQNMLRDYIFKELHQDKKSKELLAEKLKDLLNKVSLYPEAFFWYFQKIMEDEEIPLSDKKSKSHFLEAFFILVYYIEQNPQYKDLIKKMYQFLTAKRYLVFRSIIQDTTQEYLQELLLLASKCHTFTKQDKQLFVSLASVVQPSLSKKEEEEEKHDIIWTTSEGYKKIQERLHQIGTVETVDNAKEIEAARQLGDLRENSEYKFALERRSRLQSELKRLSKELKCARILTKEDIVTDAVSVGSVVDVIDSKGNKETYTLLGPWDADPEKHILSFQSKLAQVMLGHKKGEAFDFQGEKFVVKSIKSFL